MREKIEKELLSLEFKKFIRYILFDVIEINNAPTIVGTSCLNFSSESDIFSDLTSQATSFVPSETERSILMALYVTLDDLPCGISSTRENVANYPSPCPLVYEATFLHNRPLQYDRIYNHFVRRCRITPNAASRHIVRIPVTIRYADGTKSFSVMAVIMREAFLPL